jgi:hypothetical protein|tara:strand:+ start:822 stop:1376 length:555 start_codon:yes stop_codon:yes gene_type:complete
MNYINSDTELQDILEQEDKMKNTIYVNPLDPMNKYINFGKYQLDLKQLKGGKIQLRSKKGYFIKGLKGSRMTPNIKIIIDKLISNNEILFEDVEKLNENEKILLSDLAQKCEINDRLKIPSPKLSKIQSEMNKFHIMRGQIIAGNDSKELVKDFKIMLLKFMNENLVDKKEGNEIMTMLLQLGL